MNVHIGKEIESKFQESGLKIGAFAEKIHTGERNVYSIFGRKDINAGMLKDISEALGFNFFTLYESKLKQDVVSEPGEEYHPREKQISITLHLSAGIKDTEKFPELLNELNGIVTKHGFRLR